MTCKVIIVEFCNFSDFLGKQSGKLAVGLNNTTKNITYIEESRMRKEGGTFLIRSELKVR